MPWLASKIDSLRISVARRILTFVEQLPPFSRGLIHQLQTAHEYDRKFSDEYYQQTRPPEGVLLSYDRCCLFEMFPIEEFDRLESGIRRLFPRGEIRDYFEDFSESADQTVAGAWSRVGTLVPRGTHAFPVAMPTEAIDLPEHVESVEIWAHRPLPSLFVLSFHASLTKEVTDTLLRVQSAHYMPEVRFWPMIPTNIFYRSSNNPPEAVEYRTLLSYLKRIRSDLEGCLAPFLSGHFMRRSGSGPRLPAIEMYTLSGMRPDADVLEEAKHSTRTWWTFFAMEFYAWNTFQREHLVFNLNTSLRSTKEDAPYKLLALKDYVPPDARYSSLEDFLTAIIPILAVRDFLHTISTEVGKARRSTYRALVRPRFFRGLRADIGVSRQLSRQGMLLERVKVELEDSKRALRHSRLSEFANRPEGPIQKKNLFETLMERLAFCVKSAESHLQVMRDNFSEHLLVRNMALMYALQWAILGITVVAIVVSAASAAANWGQIKEFWRGLRGR